jgi:hypothetical protein
MIYSKIKLALIATLFFAGCSSKYDYTIHKPKVRYKPSLSALDKLNSSNMGKRYVWAEEGPYCFDCSGFTYFTYGTMGIEIPRVAREQFKKGTPIPRSKLQKGDLVFFDTSRSRRGVPTHVGIMSVMECLSMLVQQKNELLLALLINHIIVVDT